MPRLEPWLSGLVGSCRLAVGGYRGVVAVSAVGCCRVLSTCVGLRRGRHTCVGSVGWCRVVLVARVALASLARGGVSRVGYYQLCMYHTVLWEPIFGGEAVSGNRLPFFNFRPEPWLGPAQADDSHTGMAAFWARQARGRAAHRCPQPTRGRAHVSHVRREREPRCSFERCACPHRVMHGGGQSQKSVIQNRGTTL